MTTSRSERVTVDWFEGSTPRPWHRAGASIIGPRGEPGDGYSAIGHAAWGANASYPNAALIVYAVNLMDAWQDVAEAAGAVKQGVCGCVYTEEWVEDPGDEICGGYSVRGELRRRCNQCITHEALAAALARLAEAEKAQGDDGR